jgi:hypothetical protein
MQAIERKKDSTLSAKKTPTRVAAHKSGGKLKLVTLDSLDGRSFAVKRARLLIAELSTAVAGEDQLTAGARELIQHAAILGAMIESSETEWLSGKSVDVPNLLSAINCQRRTLIALGVIDRQRATKDVTPQDLDDIELEAEAEE